MHRTQDSQPNATPQAVLALDLGTTTGWALSLPDRSVTHGYVSFKPQRFEGGGMRYLRFRRWLDELLATTAPRGAASGLDAVYFEEVRRHLGVDAAHAYGGFLATLTSWCEHQKIPYQGVPVGTIKRIFNFTKVRYRGLAKNGNRLFVAAALGQPVHGAQAIAGIATPVVGQERTGRPRQRRSARQFSLKTRPFAENLSVRPFNGA